MQTLSFIILVPMVYAAVAVFIAGTTFRLVKIYRAPRNPATLQIYPEKGAKWFGAIYDAFTFPSVRRHKPLLWLFIMAFHIGLVLLVIGHLELIRSFDLFQIVEHRVFLGNGIVGLTLIVATLFFLFRRFHSPIREISVPSDYYLLILLLLIFLFGSQMDWARTWYEYGELTVENYRAYLMSMIMLRPELPYEVTASGHSFMLVLHVFFANLFLMIFPFSQFMHAMLALPMNKLRRG